MTTRIEAPKPDLTVLIPTFNRQSLTEQAIASVITGTPMRVEIVVIDDHGSVPFQLPDLAVFKHIQIRGIRLPENRGAGEARQAGVEKARGEYIAFLDSDDRYAEGWIDEVLAAIDRAPQSRGMMVGGTAGGSRAGALVCRLLGALPLCSRLVAARLIVLFFNPFPTPSIVVHKSCCRFMPGLRHCEDYYVNIFALFLIDKITVLRAVACELGRPPKSEGGLSASAHAMFQGELSVRRSALASAVIPLRYRMLVPLGFLYQGLRTVIKRAILIVGGLLHKRSTL